MPWITFYGAYLPQVMTRLDALEHYLVGTRTKRLKQRELIELWQQCSPDLTCPYA